jgi:hypothetical protein
MQSNSSQIRMFVATSQTSYSGISVYVHVFYFTALLTIWWIGKDREGNGSGIIGVLLWHFHGGSEENKEESQAVLSLSLPGPEHFTNASLAMYRHANPFLYKPRNLVQAVILLDYIRVLLGSNLVRDSDSTAWSFLRVSLRSLQAKAGKVP